MRTAATVTSLLALLATVVPAFMFMADSLALEAVRSWMLAGTIVWFATAPLWLDHS